MRHRFTLVAGACLLAAAVAAPAHATTGTPPLLPSADPFYTYSGTTPLADIKPGTVLAKRAVSLSLNTASSPTGSSTGLPVGNVDVIPGEQLLYRTSDEIGNPSVTVTTVMTPATAPVAPKIVDYLSFYDSLSAKCDPSYTLTGGDPDPNNAELSDIEQALVAQYYAQGYVVTIPDFEGTHLDWTAGHEAGYGALDALRATESYLGEPATTPTALTGYSGGSIAADWGAELAPAYAPELDIVGVAMGGVPVHFAHNLDYINGSAHWSGILPATLDALSRAYGFDLDTYLSDYGKQLAATDRDECIGDFNGAVPGLTIQKLLKPQWQDPYSIPDFVSVINKLIMGTAATKPAEPLFIGVGNDPQNAQGQGDDIMLTADDEALAHKYCTEGLTVKFSEYQNAPHENAALEFEPNAIAWLATRFAGTPAENDCSTIPVGSSLAPVSLHPLAASSAAAVTTKKTATKKKTVTKKASSDSASQPGGTLAYTGLEPALPAGALVLLGVAAVMRRGRKRRSHAE